MRKFPIMLFVVLLGAAGWRASSLAERLPEIVAVHFDASGNANGFATRAGCRQFMLTFTIGAPVFIVLVTALIPRLFPPSMINVPNRGYWLAPARAADSLGFLSEQGVWFGCIFLGFLSFVDELLFKANAADPPAFPTRWFIGSMILLFAAIGVWAARIFKRFRMPG